MSTTKDFIVEQLKTQIANYKSESKERTFGIKDGSHRFLKRQECIIHKQA